jgi:hypothetical protein
MRTFVHTHTCLLSHAHTLTEVRIPRTSRKTNHQTTKSVHTCACMHTHAYFRTRTHPYTGTDPEDKSKDKSSNHKKRPRERRDSNPEEDLPKRELRSRKSELTDENLNTLDESESKTCDDALDLDLQDGESDAEEGNNDEGGKNQGSECGASDTESTGGKSFKLQIKGEDKNKACVVPTEPYPENGLYKVSTT